jgi:hypothetical protein
MGRGAARDSERPGQLEPELETLVRALSALPEAVRNDVIVAAEKAAARTRTSFTWERWERARATVSLGGDALEDSDRLYDGT